MSVKHRSVPRTRCPMATAGVVVTIIEALLIELLM